jgi:hypothetical protein
MPDNLEESHAMSIPFGWHVQLIPGEQLASLGGEVWLVSLSSSRGDPVDVAVCGDPAMVNRFTDLLCRLNPDFSETAIKIPLTTSTGNIPIYNYMTGIKGYREREPVLNAPCRSPITTASNPQSALFSPASKSVAWERHCHGIDRDLSTSKSSVTITPRRAARGT